MFLTLRSVFGVDIAHPRLGTSRGHNGREPVDDPSSPKRRDKPRQETAATGVGRSTTSGVGLLWAR
ncbi:MAG TPA: hypothetical protein PLI18_17140, partial [Pirellulaceae bacterium]|nr:hypothetical protein [Pirellulaceae bacterium]